ncbi:MAG TPA: hemin uptake protein HemP [Burkholderiales bacterium]
MPTDHSRSANPVNPTAPGNGGSIPKPLTSESLLGGKREVVIEHAGREYRLRLTQYGKLILTA